MDSIVMCGYSVHRQCDFPEEIGGNRHYLIRLQSHGECGARLNDGEQFTLCKGDLLALAPGDKLKLRKDKLSDDPADVSGDYYLICRGEWVTDWYREIGERKLTRVPPNESLLELWRLLIRETRRVPEAGDEEYLESLLRTFCLSVKRLLNQGQKGESDFIVFRMRRFIEDHAVEKLRVADVAEHVSLSESRAIHLFKEITGRSIVDYLMEVRLNFAIEQMKYTGSTLEEIAENSGFGTYSYFHRVFRRLKGMSPGKFRQKYREDVDWQE